MHICSQLKHGLGHLNRADAHQCSADLRTRLHLLTGRRSFLQHCRSCGQVKASEDFPRNRMNKDGLHSYCKPCQNAKCAQYQRNSLAAKQEGRPVAGTPADVALPDEPFNTHKVCIFACQIAGSKRICFYFSCYKQETQRCQAVLAGPKFVWQIFKSKRHINMWFASFAGGCHLTAACSAKMA